MSDQKLVIGLAGDIMIGRGVDFALRHKGYSYAWGNLLPTLHSTDLNIANLETTLTNADKPVFKTFNFKGSPDTIKSLSEAKITLVNLANNHILDFSEEGLIETMQTLNKAGIKFVGAGKNENEASKPVILCANDIFIGVLGFTDNEPGWKVGTSTYGVNYIDIRSWEDRNKALLSIEQLRARTDAVIVSIHWGPNMKESPSRRFIDFAHEMIQTGASIVHGHSAHNFQGIEAYRNKLILYDTGDFVDDYVVHPDLRNDHSFFYRVELDKAGLIKLNLLPVLISNCQVNVGTNDDYRWTIKRVQDLSGRFNTTIDDEGEMGFKTIND